MSDKEESTHEYKISFVDRILDPVHGFIDLTQVEKDITELPIFKRMQSLKQLSLTNWVFPGAEHTRYIHSLGVMHIADLMAINLKNENQKPFFTDEERQVLRLAGLLHDIGHYPLSHVTEYVYQKTLNEKWNTVYDINKEAKEDIDKLCSDYEDVDYMKSRYTKPMHHEKMGTEVIKNDQDIQKIIAKYCPFIDIDDICDIIVGSVDRKPSISAMVQLIHSELDADGIDYVMRDATFSGTSYGGFELGLLLRNLVVTKYNDVDIVGVRPKGISVADQFLISKYFSYTQVIFNRHVAVLEKMAEMLSVGLIKSEKSIYPRADTLEKYVEKHTENDDYLKFTDRAFWSQLNTLTESDLGYVSDYAKAAFKGLSHYQEFSLSSNGELVFTTNNKKDAYSQLCSTDMYTQIEAKDEKHLVLFLKRGLTSEIQEEKFKDILSKTTRKSEPVSEVRFKEQNVARLQEGIPVIETGKDPRLLVDDSRSIMNHLCGTCTYILRKYEIN